MLAPTLLAAQQASAAPPAAWEPWLVGALVAAMVAALTSGRFGTDLVFFGGLTVLTLAGVIEPAQAVGGFAEPAVLTIGLLYIVSCGMKETGATNALAGALLRRPRSLAGAQLRLTAAVAATSAFLNNTPIVAMFLPVLAGVARRGGFPVSKLFMPLSFASILGGVCTLIGTSTNIVVAQLYTDEGAAGPAFGMFTLTAVGLPIALAGIAYMIVAGRRLLPGDRGRDAAEPADAKRREYMTAMRVVPDSPVVGKTVEKAGLRHLPGLFLARIDRGDASLLAVAPDETLRAGDVVNFVGDLDSVVDLQQINGLSPIVDERDSDRYRPRLMLTEAVVGQRSALTGRTIRESGIRSRYQAVVVAVHRRGHRLEGKIGDITLQPGDTLLLEAEPGFADRHRDSTDFVLINDRPGAAAPRHERAWIAFAVLAGLVVAIAAGWASPLTASMAAAGAMILTRCCTGPQARDSIDLQVLVTIGAAFGIAEAMRASGLATTVAHGITGLVMPLGVIALLAAVYALTSVFTMLMTNIAAAVLMFPIAASIADDQGLALLPFAVVIAIAASCEFSTPIGYQTNLMVMGPGGYRWLDFTRFGGPLSLLSAAVCLAVTPFAFGPLSLAADDAAPPAAPAEVIPDEHPTAEGPPPADR